MSKISEWRELLKPIIIEQIDSLRMDYRLLENSILAEKESISKMKRTFLLIKEDGAKYQKYIRKIVNAHYVIVNLNHGRLCGKKLKNPNL